MFDGVPNEDLGAAMGFIVMAVGFCSLPETWPVFRAWMMQQGIGGGDAAVAEVAAGLVEPAMHLAADLQQDIAKMIARARALGLMN